MIEFAKRAWNKRIIRFFLVGGINTLFGYGAFAFFIFLNFHYVFAALFATVLGIIFNFNTIGRIVFKKSEKKLILKFVCVYVITYLLNILGLRILNSTGLSSYISGAILILPMALIAYLLNSKFVFKNLQHQKSQKIV